MNYTAQRGQSIFDLALLTYGSLDNVVKLMQSSDMRNINEEDLSGKSFSFEVENITDASFANKIKDNKLVFASARVPQATGDLQTDDGIGLTTDDGFQIIVD